MKAMIFAAGLGTRLKPLTDHTPKALVPVNGRPMLEHVILKLKAAGCTEAVVNVHHFGQQIIDFLPPRPISETVGTLRRCKGTKTNEISEFFYP